MWRWRPAVVAIALALVGGGCTTIVRGSVASDGTSADSASMLSPSSISDTGRYVAFSSAATNLVPDDTNGVTDVFRHDNVTGETVRVSVDGAGAQIAAANIDPAISGNGDRVLFLTDAALDPADTNGRADLYLRSVAFGTTRLVSLRPDGTPILGGLPFESITDTSLSADGRFVLMLHSYPGGGTVYFRDRGTSLTVLVIDGVAQAIMSSDGATVVVNSFCPGGPCSHVSRVLFKDGDPPEVIDQECGFEALDVSADGRFVVGRRFGVYPTFECPEPTGLVRWDHGTKDFRKVPVKALVYPYVSISDTGRFVGALDDDFQVRVADLATGTNQVAETNGWAASLSGSGRYIAFIARDGRVPGDTNTFDDVYTRYAVEPAVSSVTPRSLARGSAHVPVSIAGKEFLSGATVSVSGPGVTVHSVAVGSSGRLTLDVSVDPDAAVGARDVVVSNRGGFGHSDVWCPACLTIT